MAAEKGIDREKTDGATAVTRRDLRLPWSMLAGQLGGKLQARSREWTEFRITFPKNQ